jgi:hypothetical protein
MSDANKRLYLAIVWRNGPDKPGERVSVLAKDLKEARRLLEEAYGKGNVFNLHNPDDAKKIR